MVDGAIIVYFKLFKMKKLILMATALFSMATAAFAIEQGDDNGFGLKLNVGFVSNDKFGHTRLEGSKELLSSELESRKNTPMFGLGMDTRWYVATPGKFGIAVSARWLDFSFGMSKCYSDFAGEKVLLLKGNTIKADFLMPGVIGTYYLGDDMAADVFYSFGPSLGFQNFKFADDHLEAAYETVAKKLGHDIDDVDAEFGLSQYLGAAFRYKVFQVGFEYNFAKLKAMDWFEEDEDEDMFDKMFGDILTYRRRNNFRIFIGFKF